MFQIEKIFPKNVIFLIGFHFLTFSFCSEKDESVESLVIAEVVVDDPVHQLEAGERDGEEDPAVLVDV